MGGTKATIDDLRAAFRATTTVTIDRIASDKDRVGVDVAWSQLAILVIMLVCSTRLTLDLVCAHTHTRSPHISLDFLVSGRRFRRVKLRPRK